MLPGPGALSRVRLTDSLWQSLAKVAVYLAGHLPDGL